jgi:hypothetical protein
MGWYLQRIGRAKECAEVCIGVSCSATIAGVGSMSGVQEARDRRNASACVPASCWLDKRHDPRAARPSPRRRGGRVVDRTALEMRHTGNRIGGSNPSLSATLRPGELRATAFAKKRFTLAFSLSESAHGARPSLTSRRGRQRQSRAQAPRMSDALRLIDETRGGEALPLTVSAPLTLGWVQQFQCLSERSDQRLSSLVPYGPKIEVEPLAPTGLPHVASAFITAAMNL